jgi:hypothetical protein
MCKAYNGYTNYQTWSVAVWLDNEPDTNGMLHDLANDQREFEGVFTSERDKAVYPQDWVDQCIPEYEQAHGQPYPSRYKVFDDLVNHALAQVDYQEIIQAHKETQSPAAKSQRLDPPPRYDEVYYQGLKNMEEQAIACLKCGASELIREDSPRLPEGQWPAWEPGPQGFLCPNCREGPVWATEPREVK